MLKQEKKQEIIEGFKAHEEDTGSTAVQIALLSEEITGLLSHLKKHPKDFHSKRGLLKMVARRRRFLKYLKDNDEKKYKAIIKKIGLKN